MLCLPRVRRTLQADSFSTLSRIFSRYERIFRQKSPARTVALFAHWPVRWHIFRESTKDQPDLQRPNCPFRLLILDNWLGLPSRKPILDDELDPLRGAFCRRRSVKLARLGKIR